MKIEFFDVDFDDYVPEVGMPAGVAEDLQKAIKFIKAARVASGRALELVQSSKEMDLGRWLVYDRRLNDARHELSVALGAIEIDLEG